MKKSLAQIVSQSLALWFFLSSVVLPTLVANAASMSFDFTLPSNYTTSAGAFDSSGNLVRTLWRREAYLAGPHSEVWDGLKDDGTAAPAGNYSIRVLYHNVQYVWDGAIGSTSASFDGESAWYTNNYPKGMAIDGSNAIVTTGYGEGAAGVKRFTTFNPQVSMNGASIATDTVWFHVATDGIRYYVANVGNGWDSSNATFIAAYNLSDNSVASFSNGQSITLISPWNTNHPSVIDASQQITSPTEFDQAFVNQQAATGIAVQKNGNILAVSHGPLNAVRLFHKTTGASLGNITVTAPKGLTFTPAGDLVVCSESSLKRYTGVASTNTLANTIPTGQPAIAVSAHPTTGNDMIIAAIGGSHQQVKAFSSNGTALWTYGTLGGYDVNGPDVSTQKFRFAKHVPLAMQSDGSFWVYDAATLRMLHISASQVYLEQIAWLYWNYTSAVDTNDATRVFGKSWLEYRVDYSKPLLTGDPQAAGGNKSWELVKDWSAGIPTKYVHQQNTDNEFNATFATGLHTVVTLTNPMNSSETRTFGLCRNIETGKNALVELPASGNLRETGLEFEHGYPPQKSYSLYRNGDLRYSVLNNGIQTVYKQSLQSFDNNGNPVWGTPEVMATMSGGPLDPIAGRAWPGIAPWQFPITDSGVVVSFDQSVGNTSNTGFHLGGAQLGGSEWKWQAAPAVTTNIPLDGLGSFDIGDGIQYGGNKVMTAGNQIVYGYHGEFWNQSQADMYAHFHEEGLFVGQFGVPGDVWRPGTNIIGGKGGNALTPTLVEHEGETYLWHGNESPIGGVQRWHLVGANNIREMSGTGTLGGASVTLSDPNPPFPTGLTATPDHSQVDLTWKAVNGAVSYNIKVATRPGGPYNTVATGITSSSYTMTGLSNDTRYYFMVSSVDASNQESINSSQVKATPFDSTTAVQGVGEVPFMGALREFSVNSSSLNKGKPATFLDSTFDRLGVLAHSTIGSKGYIIFNWSGDGLHSSNLPSGITITPDQNWGYSDAMAMSFKQDGVDQWRGMHGTHGLRAPENSSASIDINVSDNNWHYLTVFSPVNWNARRNQVTTLSPQDQSSPGVSYTVLEEYTDSTINGYSYIKGYNRIYQFRFKGNVTLEVERKTDDASGLIGALFIDEMPVGVSSEDLSLPNGWNHDDINAPGLAGSATYQSGVWTVTGSGADIWGTSDQFHFAHKEVNGDQTLIAKVTSVTNTNGWAKSGVMFRESLAAGSRYIGLYATQSSGGCLQWRNDTNGGASNLSIPGIPTPSATNPVWLKLIKTNNSYTGYISTDGSDWTLAGTCDVSLPSSNTLAGLAVTSHNNSLLNTATFTDVSLSNSSDTVAGSAIVTIDFETPAYADGMLYTVANGITGINQIQGSAPAHPTTFNGTSSTSTATDWSTSVVDDGTGNQVLRFENTTGDYFGGTMSTYTTEGTATGTWILRFDYTRQTANVGGPLFAFELINRGGSGMGSGQMYNDAIIGNQGRVDFIAGQSYNIRMEVDMSSISSSDRRIYVDNQLIDISNANNNVNGAAVGGFRFVFNNGSYTTRQFDLDNIIVGEADEPGHFTVNFESPAYATADQFTVVNGVTGINEIEGTPPSHPTSLDGISNATNASDWTATVTDDGNQNKVLRFDIAANDYLGGRMRGYTKGGNSTGTWEFRFDYTRLTANVGGPLFSFQLINSGYGGMGATQMYNDAIIGSEERVDFIAGQPYHIRMVVDMDSSSTTDRRLYVDDVLIDIANANFNSGGSVVAGFELNFNNGAYGARQFDLDNLSMGETAPDPFITDTSISPKKNIKLNINSVPKKHKEREGDEAYLLEYALGIDPAAGNNSPRSNSYTETIDESTYFVYSYYRRTDHQALGLTYSVIATTDLVTPNNDTPYDISISDPIDGYQEVITRYLSTHPTMFFQLKVELQP